MEFWKIIWELEYWKLNYENWKLGNCLKMEVLKIGILKNYLKIKVSKIGILENYLKMEVLKIKFKKLEFWRIIWEWKFWKLNLEIGILKNYLRMKF